MPVARAVGDRRVALHIESCTAGVASNAASDQRRRALLSQTSPWAWDDPMPAPVYQHALRSLP